MKEGKVFLGACMAAMVASAPAWANAGIHAAASSDASAAGAPRVTRTVDSNRVATLAQSHLDFITSGMRGSSPPDAFRMNHLQLVLKPDAVRHAAMETYIAQQHDPKSALFGHWLTPQQFGEAFGAADGDVAAVVSWLATQGFTVNNIYPNKLQIDFSGTVGQVNRAFHTRETIYTIGGEKHLANDSDILVPSALADVVAGVMGLNDFRATPLPGASQPAQPNAAIPSPAAKAGNQAMRRSGSYAVPVPSGYWTIRALVPNDMVTMYGIRAIRNNGVVGKGVTIAVVESRDMLQSGWNNFVSVFNLAQYGGSFSQVNPAPPSGPSNCLDPNSIFSGPPFDAPETVRDAEWVTAIAPGAHLIVAACSDQDSELNNMTSNVFGGVFIAAANLINGASRPDIISASASLGEAYADVASKTAIDQMWAQADAEGISVFVATGDQGVIAKNPARTYVGNALQTLDTNALATSAHVTAVGGTDLADTVDGTTDKYFLATPSIVGGSALSYVPEIPWNQTCGNGVVAKHFGFSGVVAFCVAISEGLVGGDLGPYDPNSNYPYLTGSGGGASTVVAKPVWQAGVFNAASDQSRDVPDVAMFGGSFSLNSVTLIMTCTVAQPCSNGGNGQAAVVGGTGLSAAMFAGVQALMDQGLAARGMPLDQGNAAPTLYALAATEYGGASGPIPASLAACSADNGATGTDNCIFHNVTRGSISSPCNDFIPQYSVRNCFYYYGYDGGSGFTYRAGLTTTDAAPTHYNVDNKAFGAHPGWSFAAGLGSVNAKNLLIAWRAYLHAPPATP